MTTDTAPDEAGVTAAVHALLEAVRLGVPTDPIRDLVGGGDVATGYAVQQLLTEARLAAGGRRVGRKIGLTSPSVQQQLGVDSPDVGVLFADMDRSADAVIDRSGLLQPRIEAEVAVILGRDLDDDVSPAAVLAAVDHIVPAFEIVDSRIRDWDITLVDTVADNASSGLYVLGSPRRSAADVDLPGIEMTLTDGDGATVSAGTGADCLGDPLLAVAWLARTVLELGDPLRAGEVILSGALGPMVPVGPGSRFTASLSGLGEVRATFG